MASYNKRNFEHSDEVLILPSGTPAVVYAVWPTIVECLVETEAGTSICLVKKENLLLERRFKEVA
jgi:hypothetical protein